MKHEATTPGHHSTVLLDEDRPFCVGKWQVEPRAHQVAGPSGVLHLTPKAMQVLCFLAAKPGRVGTKEDLLATVWVGTVVTESVVPRAISEIRRVLGDDASDPHIIETIPTVGYRLIAPVTFPDTTAQRAPQVLAQVPERRRWWLERSVVLAVLGGMLLTALAGVALWQSRRDFEMDGFVMLEAYVGEEIVSSASPDGQQVAFIAEEADGQQVDLYVQPAGATVPFRLTDTSERERSPAWSPDSQYLGFVQTSATTCGLYIIPATGGTAQRLCGCEPGQRYHVKWSQDGAWLALVEYSPARKPARITMLPVPDRERRLPGVPLLLLGR